MVINTYTTHTWSCGMKDDESNSIKRDLHSIKRALHSNYTEHFLYPLTTRRNAASYKVLLKL